MDSFELNKIIGALLGVVFVVFSVSILSDALFHSPAPATPGYAIAVPEDSDAEGAGEEPVEESVLPLLAEADPSAGESIFKRCQACHTVEEGGPNKVGPNLWNVVNRPIASHEGFSYSAALKEFSQGGEVVWDYEHLDHFLKDPKGLVPGTAMSYAGLKNVEDRANLIAYLRNLSSDPAPLPEVSGEDETAAEGAESEAAPAEEASEPAEKAAEETPAPEEMEEGDGGAPDTTASPASSAN
ncbi:cytochrome c family protein [Chelativorans sp. M5D2P16]|uniref:c-type cytochrome n=1 Tax=Chelativorans sp. M5D2P16 TaxID=3095678 RepID=UPI002ACAF59A|nr:cytochrome c family protein [Chelativorans sp. M5D2P16]MDZ5700148.1 cytochrome c family protein [Chelativorans sp. M5D2P16]